MDERVKRIEYLIKELKAQRDHYKRRRDCHPHGSSQWQYWDDRMSELDCKIRYYNSLLPLLGREWRCPNCGTKYSPEWVAYYGPVCYIDCNAYLEEVGKCSG